MQLVAKSATIHRLLLFVLALASFVASQAQAQLYGVTRNTQLYSVIQTTGASTFIGNIPATGGATNEIAIDPLSGNAYVLHGGFSSQLLQQISLVDGSLVGSFVALSGEFSSLEFVGSKLYGSGAVGSFYEINPTSGALTLIGSGIRAGGLAYDTNSGTMYGVGQDGGFYSIDLVTGLKTVISSAPLSLGIHRNLDFGSDGRLYAEGNQNLYVLDPTTGNATLVGPTTGTAALFTGLAGPGSSVAPIPEPEIYAMLGVGLGLLGWVARRKRSKEAA